MMTRVLTHPARSLLLSVTAAAMLSTAGYADCKYELFNIASVKGTTIGEFIDQLSEECGMSIIVADPEAEKVLAKQMNKTFLKNLTINEVLDIIIKENDLQYTLENNVLKISYLTTKTYNIDYIISQRKGVGSTDITLSSQTGTSSGTSSTTGTSSTSSTSSTGTSSTSGRGGSTARSQSGMKITSTDEVQFWDMLDVELESVLNRPDDEYKAQAPVINKAAGLITVTATGDQLKRLDQYLEDLQKKMQTQVLIDVKMYSVVFSDASTTGIDWSQLYALQNIDLGYNYYNLRNVDSFTADSTGTSKIMFPITELTPGVGSTGVSVFQLGAKGSLSEVIKFLKTQGDVYSISNPKVLTLNNQPALITAGTELFYKITNTTSTTTTATTTSTDETINSVFSGVLLDITPEISSDNTITLRINPSISETASTVSTDNSLRSMPPDLTRRQLSSVVTAKDGNRIILGGLISTKTSNDTNKVPLLGDLPLLGYLFKHEAKTKKVEELVIIIEPHIVKKENDSLKLSDLGYSRLKNDANQPLETESK